MSKKDKRIKKLEELNADMAIECDGMETTISGLRSSNIRLIGGMLRVREERDELQWLYDTRGEYVAYLEGQVDDLIATVRHAEEMAVYADELRDENDRLKKQAERFTKLYNLESVENVELKSKIKAITAAAVDWAEHGSALIAELSDGDEG